MGRRAVVSLKIERVHRMFYMQSSDYADIPFETRPIKMQHGKWILQKFQLTVHRETLSDQYHCVYSVNDVLCVLFLWILRICMSMFESFD